MDQNSASDLYLDELLVSSINLANGNEWSPIRSVIIHDLFNHKYDYRPYWTTRITVTN